MSLLKPNKRWLLLLFLLYLIPAFLRPVDRQQELRVLLVARTMVETGDWLHPVFQNQPRYRKPPFAYWTTATAMTLTGNRHSAVPPRVLNLLAAFAVVLLARDLARRHDIPEHTCTLLLLLSYGFWNFAPHAETDLWLLLGVTGAFWSWTRKNGWAAGGFMALGVLAKGPAAVAIPLLSFLLLDRRNWQFWLGAVLLPALAGGGWILFLQTDPVAQAALQQELSDTFVDSPHAGPFYYYLYTLPKVLLPGILVLPWLRKAAVPRLAWIWFIVALLLLSLIPSKQDHYALLLLPPAVLCLAAMLKPDLRKAAIGVGIIVLLVEIASVASALTTTKFLRAVRPMTATTATLHVVGMNSAIFDWYLGRHVENTDSVLHAYERAKPGDAIVVVQEVTANPVSDPQPLPPTTYSATDGRIQRDFWIKE